MGILCCVGEVDEDEVIDYGPRRESRRRNSRRDLSVSYSVLKESRYSPFVILSLNRCIFFTFRWIQEMKAKKEVLEMEMRLKMRGLEGLDEKAKKMENIGERWEMSDRRIRSTQKVNRWLMNGIADPSKLKSLGVDPLRIRNLDDVVFFDSNSGPPPPSEHDRYANICLPKNSTAQHTDEYAPLPTH